jgi:hypothetical protein
MQQGSDPHTARVRSVRRSILLVEIGLPKFQGMPDAPLKSENAFSVLHLSETLKLCCQSAICNFGGLRTVCNALGGLRDPEETLLPATVQLYSY